jgi:hypothetical protein
MDEFERALKKDLATNCLLTIAIILVAIAVLKSGEIKDPFYAVMFILVVIILIIRGVWQLKLVIR